MDERDFFLSFSSSVPVTLNFNELNKSVKRSQLISDLLSRMDYNSQICIVKTDGLFLEHSTL